MKSKKSRKPVDEDFLNTGALVKLMLTQKKVSIAELARKVKRSRVSLHNTLDYPDLRVGLLLEVSRALNYNFFRHIANLLPPDMPPAAPPDSAPLEQKIAALEQEIAVLNGVIAWMKSDKEE